tara:strand:- start:235 stop:600 length:366 start_codon:yes stop_codon:yes gene_type:complete
VKNVTEKAPSILNQIAELRRDVRAGVAANKIRGYPIVTTDGWRIVMADKDDYERYDNYGSGRISMAYIKQVVAEAVKEFGTDAVVWIEGRYDYATHVDTNAAEYDYEVGDYWEFPLLGSFR